MLVKLCLTLVFGLSLSTGQTTLQKNVICLYRYYSGTLPGVTTYTIADIEPTVCTHLVYISAYVEDVLKMQFSETHYNQWETLQDLKISNPSLKLLLGVDDFSAKMESETYENIQTVINNIIFVLRHYGLDGVDFIWYKQVTQGIVTFIQEMQAAFEYEATSGSRERLTIMFSVPGWNGAIQAGLDLQPLGQAVDILDVTLYKYSSSTFYTQTGLANPLYGNGGYRGNVSASINRYLDAGVAPEKLHIVTELYATTFTLLNPELTEVGDPAQGYGVKGEYTQQKGEISYYEVCKRLLEGGYTAEVDPEGMVNFAYKDNQWMTYEDPASLEIKMDYVHTHSLGGVTVWYLSEDDYTGDFCNQGRYPLISTLYRFAFEIATTTPATTTPAPQVCPYSTDRFADPYSCQHYRQCVFDMLFRVACDPGLSYDSVLKDCVQNPTTTCVTVPPPTE